jgi:hypothetical protein
MGLTTPDRLYKEYLKSIEKSGQSIDLLESGHNRMHELDEFYVQNYGRRTPITQQKILELTDCIKTANKEEDIQKHLAKNPKFLTRILLGNHGSWCITKPKFGCQRVPDFLVAELDSLGFRWYGIELENTKKVMYTQRGIQSAALTEAINQIDDWRIWLKNNIEYAQKPIEKDGLGLIDIDCNLPCFIFIGRRRDQVKGTKQKRRQILNDKNIDVHHYDWLIERARPPRYVQKINFDDFEEL